jgi:hypothetical protein
LVSFFCSESGKVLQKSHPNGEISFLSTNKTSLFQHLEHVIIANFKIIYICKWFQSSISSKNFIWRLIRALILPNKRYCCDNGLDSWIDRSLQLLKPTISTTLFQNSLKYNNTHSLTEFWKSYNIYQKC